VVCDDYERAFAITMQLLLDKYLQEVLGTVPMAQGYLRDY